MNLDSNKIYEQTYLQQLKAQAPVKYVYSKYNEQQAHVIVNEYWKLFQTNLPDVMQTLFGVKAANLTVSDTHTLRAEYHAVYEIKRGCHKFLNFSHTTTYTEDVEYGYQDYKGDWHHAYTLPEVHSSTDQSGCIVSCDVKDYGFYARKTDSPILHRWITPNDHNTFDCTCKAALYDTPYNFYNSTIARPIDARWSVIDECSKVHLSNAVREEMRKSTRFGFGGIGFDENEIATEGKRQVLLWPFYFADFKVNEHTFTVRIDAVNGFVNLYLDNPSGSVTEVDETNARLKSLERQEGKRSNSESRHNQYMHDTGIDEDKLGTISLVCGIASLFVPFILSIVSIIFGVKAIKYADEGKGKAIVGIVISVITILMYAIYFIGGIILQLNDPEALAQLLSLGI